MKFGTPFPYVAWWSLTIDMKDRARELRKLRLILRLPAKQLIEGGFANAQFE